MGEWFSGNNFIVHLGELQIFCYLVGSYKVRVQANQIASEIKNSSHEPGTDSR